MATPLSLPFSKRQLAIIVSALGVLGVILALLFIRPGGPAPANFKADLTLWGVLDEKEVMELIGAYRGVQGQVKIQYTKFDEKLYAQRLVNALAAGEGPDLMMIKNSWLPRERAKLVPAAPLSIGPAAMQEKFPTVVGQDFISSDGLVYAVPLYLDTLALFYNRDLFDQAGVVVPPRSWTEFQSVIPSLRAMTPTKQIVRPAAAIGGSLRTIDTAPDLVELLMLQNGAPMVQSDLSRADFGVGRGGGGVEALAFYAQFGSAASPYYTWQDVTAPHYLESFVGGKTAMLFDYHRRLAEIKKKSPFLNVVAGPVPQAGDEASKVALADYWGLAVSKQSVNAAAAWDFIVTTATEPETMRAFGAVMGRPPALRTLIAEASTDPVLGVFARQALIARSWYRIDADAVRDSLGVAIMKVLTGQTTPARALEEAELRITQLMKETTTK